MLLDGSDGCVGGESCKVEGCGLRLVLSVSFCRLPLISQLQALARNKGSFDQLRRGQERAVASLDRLSSPTLYDYYDGALCRRIYAGLSRFAAENDEVLVCLRMTTDGFKVHEGRRKQRSACTVNKADALKMP